jgi:hypothetical protein
VYILRISPIMSTILPHMRRTVWHNCTFCLTLLLLLTLSHVVTTYLFILFSQLCCLFTEEVWKTVVALAAETGTAADYVCYSANFCSGANVDFVTVATVAPMWEHCFHRTSWGLCPSHCCYPLQGPQTLGYLGSSWVVMELDQGFQVHFLGS